MAQSIRSLGKSSFTKEEVMDQLELKIVQPEENDNYFANIIGNRDIVSFFSEMVKDYHSESENANSKETVLDEVEYHPSFILIGEEGIGKTLTAFSFAKEMGFPILVINTENLFVDCSRKMFNGLKLVVESINPCVVLFKDLNYVSQLEQANQAKLYNELKRLKNLVPESFFFVTFSATTAYPSFFGGEDGFDTSLSYNPPDPKEREALINKFIQVYPHDPDLNIEKLARDFIGYTGGEIKNLLKKSYYLSGKKPLTYIIINQTMYSEMYGSKVRKMSEKELRLTAFHEAGHVIAGYYGCPNYKVTKVEVVYRQDSLGITDPEVDDDKLTLLREDILGEIRVCLGGFCGEEAEYGTTTSGVIQDLMQATAYAQAYIEKFGMDPDFGPVYVDDDEFFSDALRQISDIKMQNLLKKLQNETTKIMLEHKDKLVALAEALVQKETLYKEEILEILEGPTKKE